MLRIEETLGVLLGIVIIEALDERERESSYV